MSDRWTTPRHDAWHDEQPTTPEGVEAAPPLAESLRGFPIKYDSRIKPGTIIFTSGDKVESVVDLLNENTTLRARIEALTAERDRALTTIGLMRDDHLASVNFIRDRAEAAESERDTLRERVAKLEAVREAAKSVTQRAHLYGFGDLAHFVMSTRPMFDLESALAVAEES